MTQSENLYSGRQVISNTSRLFNTLLRWCRSNPAVDQWRSQVLFSVAAASGGTVAAAGAVSNSPSSESVRNPAAASNIRNGYQSTYYYDSLGYTPEPYPPLASSVQADVCVIGGGLAGLATAMSLAERGRSVVLLEGGRVAHSASGLNGGFALGGYAVEPDQLIEELGEDDAAELYRECMGAQRLLASRLDRHRIECDRRQTGSLTISMFASRERGYHAEAEYLNRRFGTAFECWPASRVRAMFRSARYHHAMYDPNTFTVNPLAMCLGLARVCAQQLGVRIHEQSWATRLEKLPPAQFTLSPATASVNPPSAANSTTLTTTAPPATTTTTPSPVPDRTATVLAARSFADLQTPSVVTRPLPSQPSPVPSNPVVQAARWRVYVLPHRSSPPASPLWSYLPWPLLSRLWWPANIRAAIAHRPGGNVLPSLLPRETAFATNPWLAPDCVSVLAHDVVLCGGPSLPPLLEPRVANAAVTAHTFIGVTERLPPEQLESAVAADYAACDDRFALNYYRRLPDNRLLWGGFIQTYPVSQRSLHNALQRDLAATFPQLRGVRFEYVWGGPLAYAMHMMPLLGRADEGLYYASGFGGHGVVPTTLAGELLAGAIVDPADNRYERLFERRFPLGFSGQPLGPVAVQVMYWWYQLRDSFDLARAQWTRRESGGK